VKGFIKHPVRVAGRLIWLCAELIIAAVGFLCAAFYRSPNHARTRWLQICCRRLLPVVGIRCGVAGKLPASGLLVSNHLSYVDILVFGAICPSVFVAKREVKSWPVFGWLAILAGTLFVDRNRCSAVIQTNHEIAEVLNANQVVVIFPEGTSSDGSTVLPFKSSLLEPAVNLDQPVTTACLHYVLLDGDVAEEVCYWKDMTFVPHLINLLSKNGIVASILVEQGERRPVDRKALAMTLHSSVSAMHRLTIQESSRASYVGAGQSSFTPVHG